MITLKTVFMVGAVLVFMSLLAVDVSAGLANSLENILYDLNSFFSNNQYQSYAKIIDFAIFFIMFTAACYMGLHKWAGDKTPHGAVVGVAVSLGLAMAIPLVLYTNVSVALLFPFAKAFLFMIIVWLIWNVLVKAGMSKWRAFLLALLLTFLMFLLAGYLLSDGTGGGFGGLFDTSFGRVDLPRPGLPDVHLPGTGGKGRGDCKIEGIFAVNKASLGDIIEGEENPATQVSADGINCQSGTIRIYGYASMEGDESYNTQLSSDRAEAVKQAILEEWGPGYGSISASGEGSTWAFSSPSADDRADPDTAPEETLKPNRRYVIQCTCKQSTTTDPSQKPNCKALEKQIDEKIKAAENAENNRDKATDPTKKMEYADEADKLYEDADALSQEYDREGCRK